MGFLNFLFLLHLLMLPWMSGEFHRRYSGSRPIGFALALCLLPALSLVLAYRLFLRYPVFSTASGRRRNRSALFLAYSFMGIPLGIGAWILLAGGLIWSKQDRITPLTVGGIPILIFLVAIVFIRYFLKRCRHDTFLAARDGIGYTSRS